STRTHRFGSERRQGSRRRCAQGHQRRCFQRRSRRGQGQTRGSRRYRRAQIRPIGPKVISFGLLASQCVSAMVRTGEKNKNKKEAIWAICSVTKQLLVFQICVF